MKFRGQIAGRLGTIALVACAVAMTSDSSAQVRVHFQDDQKRWTPFCSLLGCPGVRNDTYIPKHKPQAIELRVPSLREHDLFRVEWRESPYPGYYHLLNVLESGDAHLVRVVPDWARQGAGAVKLSPESLSEIRRQLAALGDYSDLAVAASNPAATDIVVAYNGRLGSARYRFCGSLPSDVERIVRTVAAAMEEQRPEFVTGEPEAR